MTLPAWYLRRYVEPGGVRLEKRASPVEMAGLCAECHQPVFWTKIHGANQPDGVWRQGEYWHYKCAPTPVQAWIKKTSKIIDKVPVGNLGQEEYRFWVGCDAAVFGSTEFAFCRCCKTSVYGRQARIQHFLEDKFYLNGDPCSTRLVNAYKRLLEQFKSCIVCKKDRYQNSKWGVPLCGQTECERRWKFDQVKYLVLEVQLDQQKKEARASQMKMVGKPTGTVYVTGEDGVTTPRPYCQICQMFADNSQHAEIHESGVASGEIYPS